MMSGHATAGGSVRDKEGNWIVGFYRFLDKCSIFDAELWGILDGLILFNKEDMIKLSSFLIVWKQLKPFLEGHL